MRRYHRLVTEPEALPRIIRPADFGFSMGVTVLAAGFGIWLVAGPAREAGQTLGALLMVMLLVGSMVYLTWSVRAVVTDDGLEVHNAFERRLFRWGEIREVTVIRHAFRRSRFVGYVHLIDGSAHRIQALGGPRHAGERLTAEVEALNRYAGHD
jgi:hypothetical protein